MHKREHMTVAIMQPYFFPYLGYWQLVESADTFVIYDDGHYRPRGFINRNSILIDGLPHLLTLSLVAKSCHKLINEIEVGVAILLVAYPSTELLCCVAMNQL